MALHRFAVPLAFLITTLTSTTAISCPPNLVTSCSNEATTNNMDPCCVPSPGGVIIFGQKFEADVGDDGEWRIDGIEVWDCSMKPLTQLSPSAPRAYNTEEISSFTARSGFPAFSPSQQSATENEWAESEVGEGVEEIWSRAWSKGGRLVSTLERRCFESKEEFGLEVPLFFNALHKIHRTIHPYEYLQRADITPADDTTYSLIEITAALTTGGLSPYITCINSTLSSIYWPLYVIGKFQDADFVAAEGDFSDRSNCPRDGIRYPPSEAHPAPATTHTWDPIYRPSPRPLNVQGDSLAGMFQPGDKRVVDEKLKFFKNAEDVREGKKESPKGKAGMRDKDEL